MKVKFYITNKKRRVDFIADYVSTLKARFDMASDLSDADMLLVFGIWDYSASRLARKALRMGIPYIAVPLGDLSAWNLRTPLASRAMQTVLFANRLVRHAQGLIATNHAEKKRLDEIKWNRHVSLVTDYLFSSSTDQETMVGDYRNVMDRVLEKYDDNTRRLARARADAIAQNSDDTPEKRLLFQLMLIKGRMPHENVPSGQLEKMYTLLMADDYDEDTLCLLIHRARLDAFAASLWHVLAQLHQLGEGFMPSPPADDRLSRRIASYVRPRPSDGAEGHGAPPPQPAKA